jgi:beta-glucosidase
MNRQGTLALVCVSALSVSLLPASAASAAASAGVTVSADRAVYTVSEGSSASVGLTVRTADGRPLAADTTVRVDAVGGTATAGDDFTAAAGAVTFGRGTPSGTTRAYLVAGFRDGVAEPAETLSLRLSSASASMTGAAPSVVINANDMPYLDSRQSVDKRVRDLLRRMTLEEKIGQMTQAERGAVTGDPTLIAQWRLGSVLSGGGSVPTPNTPAAWVQMVNTFQAQALSTRLQIPMIYGIDAVHGHGNVYGATIFPHNIGLGSTRDPALVSRIGHAVAQEVRATGIPWDFAPCVCVTRDERWGRSYESFGETPALVVPMTSIIDGLQGTGLGDPEGVLATAKHYAGDGDTEYDQAAADANVGKPWYEQRYTIDQGITVTSRRDFEHIDLPPYEAAIGSHNVGSVMPSFSSVDWTEDGVGNPIKMHANRQLITDRLKKDMRFGGFVISDWEGIHQIPDPANPSQGGLTPYKVRVGVNAGTDMFMEPFSALQFEQLLLAEVQAGRVSVARIDDAVSRILRKKFELGLFEHPYASADNLDAVGSDAHRALARQAAAQSQVLLKNSGNTLPLSPSAKVYVAGRNADDIGNQMGGWTIQWQGVSGAGVQPGTTILGGIRSYAPSAVFSVDASAPVGDATVGVVVVGETPYAEGFGDVGGPECGFCTPAQLEEKSLSLQASDRAVIDKVCSALPTCVVLVVSGRPQLVTDQLGEMDALVASWLPGSEGTGVADVLFGSRPFTGQLSVTWPASADQVPINVGDANYHPLFPFGWGLRTGAATAASSSASLASLGKSLAAAPAGSSLVHNILGIARDRAQAAVVAGRAPANWASLIAGADVASLSGQPLRAWGLLLQVAR